MRALKLRQNMKKVSLYTAVVTPLLILISFYTYSEQLESYDVESSAKCIDSAFGNIISRNDIEDNTESFYQCFPKTFDNFVSVFGYSDLDTAGPLAENDKAYDFIDFFFELSESNGQHNDVIQLSVEGFWQIDNVAYLQHMLHSFVTKNLDESINELSKLSPRELESFWFFYFDGQTPLREMPKELSALKAKNLDVYLVAESEFKRSINPKQSY